MLQQRLESALFTSDDCGSMHDEAPGMRSGLFKTLRETRRLLSDREGQLPN